MAQIIGILGAGQLGKMLAEAATRLGFKTHVFAPDLDPIAAQASTYYTKGDYNDRAALKKFADDVDVITLEFENVPVGPLKPLFTPVYPSDSVLEISQHRISEKRLARSLSIGAAASADVTDEESLHAAIELIGMPGILKTSRLGYDGKGQWKIMARADIPVLDFSVPQEFIYEGFVPFEREISIIIARSTRGEVRYFEPVENVHKNLVLHTTTVPVDLSEEIVAKAIVIASKLVTALEVVGLLSVELFVTKDGEVLLNEIAPRPHNSGHWTLDGCNVSQFEQAIRAVTGMPLIKPVRTAKKVVMTNLIGDDVNDLSKWENTPGAHIHIYGKKEIRPGRKMGHVTVVED